MRKGQWIGLTVLAALAAALCFFYARTDITVFGLRCNTVITRELAFHGDEIPSLDALCGALDGFHHLETVDLGTFAIDAADENTLRERYGNTEMIFDTYVDLDGDHVPSKTRELDLSGKTIKDAGTLSEKLQYFTDLKTVRLGSAYPHTLYEALENAFPDVRFIGVRLFPLGGTMLPQDTRRIDLVELPLPEDYAFAALKDELAHFPSLENADLSALPLSMEQKYDIRDAFPAVRFDFPIEYLDLDIDTHTELLDVSGRKKLDIDELERVMTLMPDLKKVDMCGCGIANEQMAELRDRHPECEIVWRVYMGQWSLRTDAVAFSVLIYNYRHKRLTSRDIEVLKFCPKLEALDLGHQAITDLSPIADNLPNLRLLILADNSIRDLSPLAKLKHLHYLEFFVNGVTDLSPLAECRELVDLNISYNYNIRDISPLLDLPLLERLWLESTAVSEKDVALLRETYPNAKIVRNGSGSIDQGWRTHARYYDMIHMFLYATGDPLPESFAMYG